MSFSQNLDKSEDVSSVKSKVGITIGNDFLQITMTRKHFLDIRYVNLLRPNYLRHRGRSSSLMLVL